jgi:SAM-dependent methyltransferase
VVAASARADRYDTIGVGYASRRREEPSWAAAIAGALDGAASVLNVGAGSGNYEPRTATLVALEPSATMLAQRRPGAAPAIQGVAEQLPFGDGTFDAALAILTVHHWTDPRRGLEELRRVARRQVVVTFDPAATAGFWLHRDYLPELAAHERAQSSLADVLDALEVDRVTALEVPRDCADGFLGATWAAPDAYLDPIARASMSGFALLDPAAVARAMEALARDIDDGTWARRNADLLDRDRLDVGFRLVTAGGG